MIRTSSFNTTIISFNFSTKRCFCPSKVLTETRRGGGAYSGVKRSMSFFNLKSAPGAYSEEYGI